MSLSLRDEGHEKSFTRRALIVGAGQAGVLVLLGARLGWLQLANEDKYKTLSDKNRIDLKMLAPSRGTVLDRNGQALANNEQNFRVVVVPEQAKDPETALRDLQKLVDLSDAEIRLALENIKKVAKYISVEIKDQLTWQDVAKIEVNLPDLPGLSIEVGELRSYPFGEATAHVIGYVAAPTQDDVARDPLYSLPGFKVGKTGIEHNFDDLMKGSGGLSQVEVNVTGREVRELKRDVAEPGKDLSLTLDIELQAFVQKRLQTEDSASAILLDARNGAVYAMASHPSFDPNLFVRGMPLNVWEGLLSKRGKPLNNKAVSGLYPPASTFKMIVALAALEQKKITANTRVFCPGHYDFGSKRFHCWKRGGHGSVNLVEALTVSCDTFFYDLAKDMDISTLADMALRFGLGEKTGFDLQEEKSGLVPDQKWKLGAIGQKWQQGETIVSSIGQGYLQATPLQLAVMQAQLINGGRPITPHLLKDKQLPMHEKVAINPKHLKLVKQGTDKAVNHEDGTAFGSRSTTPGFTFGGKTGTAQVKRITSEQRAGGVLNETLPWRQRHHALFTGYAPLNNPSIVCSVVVEHGVGGSRTAAPIARDILQKAQEILDL